MSDYDHGTKFQSVKGSVPQREGVILMKTVALDTSDEWAAGKHEACT